MNSGRDRAVPIVEPDMGCVLGCRLGEPFEAVASRWPGGEVSRSASGRFTYTLTQPVGRVGACVRGEYQFVDERLVAIELRPERGAVGGIERHLHRQLMEEVVAGMPGEPTLRDEGYTAYDLDALRVVLDTIDATIRFEEAL